MGGETSREKKKMARKKQLLFPCCFLLQSVSPKPWPGKIAGEEKWLIANEKIAVSGGFVPLLFTMTF